MIFVLPCCFDTAHAIGAIWNTLMYIKLPPSYACLPLTMGDRREIPENQDPFHPP
jgi:hypothetical protein